MKKFNVGDRVRVRSWDDMEKEFGMKKNPLLDDLGLPHAAYINTPLGFVESMKRRQSTGLSLCKAL